MSARSDVLAGRRVAVRVAGTLWVVCFAMIVSGLLLLAASRDAALPPEANPWGAKVVDLATLIVYPTLAALILIRRPRNAVGWLFCVASLAGVFTSFADASRMPSTARFKPSSSSGSISPFGPVRSLTVNLSSRGTSGGGRFTERS